MDGFIDTVLIAGADGMISTAGWLDVFIAAFTGWLVLDFVSGAIWRGFLSCATFCAVFDGLSDTGNGFTGCTVALMSDAGPCFAVPAVDASSFSDGDSRL